MFNKNYRKRGEKIWQISGKILYNKKNGEIFLNSTFPSLIVLSSLSDFSKNLEKNVETENANCSNGNRTAECHSSHTNVDNEINKMLVPFKDFLHLFKSIAITTTHMQIYLYTHVQILNKSTLTHKSSIIKCI